MISIESVARAAGGENAAREQLYTDTYQQMYRTAFPLVKNRTDAENVLREAYITAFQELPNLQNALMFESWLTKIVVTKCRDLLRRNNPGRYASTDSDDSNSPSMPFADDSEEHDPGSNEDRRGVAKIIGEMLSALPNKLHECIVLFYSQQLNVSDIAQALEISENSVKSRLYNGRSKLKSMVEEREQRGENLYGINGDTVVPFLIWLLRRCGGNVTPPQLPASPSADTANEKPLNAVAAGSPLQGSALQGAANAAGSAWQGAANAAGSAWQGAANAAGSAWQGAANAAGSAWQGAANAAGSAWQGAANTAGSAWQGAANAAGSAWQGAENTAGSAWQGAANTAGSAWQGAANTAGSAWQGAAGTVVKGAANAAGSIAGKSSKSALLKIAVTVVTVIAAVSIGSSVATSVTPGILRDVPILSIFESGPVKVIDRFEDATNNHDIDTMIHCFDPKTSAVYEMVNGYLFSGGLTSLLGISYDFTLVEMHIDILDCEINGSKATVTADISFDCDGEREESKSEKIELMKFNGKWYLDGDVEGFFSSMLE